MGLDWQATSEIVFGRCIDGRENLAKFQSSWFEQPYADAFDKLKDGATKTDIVRSLSVSAYQSAIHAAQSLNGAGEDVDWVKILYRRFKENSVADKFDNVSKKLRKGQDVDIIPAIELAKDLSDPERSGLICSNLVDYENFTELMPSGWDALDYNLGGMPHAAPLVVGGETGLGKSFWSMKCLERFLRRYPERVGAVYSQEMPKEQYLSRCDRVYNMGDLIREGRILVSDRAVNIDDVAAESAGVNNLGIIIVDYVDYLVKKKTEEEYANAYQTSNDICRTLKIPFLMIAQPNRNQYQDPIPRMHHLRWSGMAENVAGGVIMLWKPKDATMTEDEYEELEKASGFTFVENSMYMVVWKWRGGWVGDDEKNNLPLDGKARIGPGAIVLPKVKGIWADEKGRWLKYGDISRSMKTIKRKRQ